MSPEVVSHLRGGLSKALMPVTAALVVVLLGIAVPRFLTTENIANIVGQSAPWVILAAAQSLALLGKGLDLSQGGVLVMTSVIFALAADHMPISMAAMLGLLLGVVAGAISGGLVAFGLSPFVVTLGLGGALQGAALLLSNGQPISVLSADFASLYFGSTLGVPHPLAAAGIVCLALLVLLRWSIWGRWVIALGSNERAAALCGIPVPLVRASTYVFCGVLTSLGSILLSSRIASGHPTAGSDAALRSVGAAVIGGVSLFGGRGTVTGVLGGALFLGALGNALNLMNVSSFVQQVAIGVAIILAAVVDKWRVGFHE